MKLVTLFSSLLVADAAKRSQVNMTISIEGNPTPLKLSMEMYDDVTPITVGHFLEGCRLPAGQGYTNSIFHRIIPKFMAQGGDVERGNGTGGRPGLSRFDDENFTMKHDGRGILSMANSGPNTNGSQFFITFVKTPWLDNRHVVFGKVKSGKENSDTLSALEAVGSNSGKTTKKVTITECKVV